MQHCTASFKVAHFEVCHGIQEPGCTAAVFKSRPNCLSSGCLYSSLGKDRDARRDCLIPTKTMINTFGKTTPHAHVFHGTKTGLHAPVVGPFKLLGLPRISRVNHRRLTPVRINTTTCTAVSSLSESQTPLHSSTAVMATEGVEVPIPELQQLCKGALKGLGYDDQQAALITEVCKCCAAPLYR